MKVSPMKRYCILFIILSFLSVVAYGQNTSDTLRVKTRLAELTLKSNQLKKQIAKEDKQRNARIEGVEPEQMELVNLRQDSICMELRSQLVDVELEMAELTTVQSSAVTVTTSQAQGSNNIHQILQSLKPNRPSKE